MTGTVPRGRPSTAFHSTLVIGGLAVIGVLAMVIWSGGDASQADRAPGGTIPGVPTNDGGFDGSGGDGGQVNDDGDDPSVAADDGGASESGSGGGGVSESGSSESGGGEEATVEAAPTGGGDGPAPPGEQPGAADPGASASMLGVLPDPEGATELESDDPGIRTWRVPGAEWETVRDDYLRVLATSDRYGWDSELKQTFAEDGVQGEEYIVSGGSSLPGELEIAFASVEGETLVEATR